MTSLKRRKMGNFTEFMNVSPLILRCWNFRRKIVINIVFNVLYSETYQHVVFIDCGKYLTINYLFFSILWIISLVRFPFSVKFMKLNNTTSSSHLTVACYSERRWKLTTSDSSQRYEVFCLGREHPNQNRSSPPEILLLLTETCDRTDSSVAFGHSALLVLN